MYIWIVVCSLVCLFVIGFGGGLVGVDYQWIVVVVFEVELGDQVFEEFYVVVFQVVVVGLDVIYVFGYQGVVGGMDQGVEEQQVFVGVE